MMFLLVKNMTLRSIFDRLEEGQVVPLAGADGDGDDDGSFVGEHERYHSENEGDDADEGGEEEEDGEEEEEDYLSFRGLALKKLHDLMLSPDQWNHTAVYEALMEQVREAVIRLQPGKYNLIHETLRILVQLRRHFDGSYFYVATRPSDYRLVREENYKIELKSRASVFASCPFAETLCDQMVEQLNLRFLQRAMPKWIYIMAILNISNYKLDRLFDGLKVTLAEAMVMLKDELLDVVRRFFPGKERAPIPSIPDNGLAGGGSAAGGGAAAAAAAGGSASATPTSMHKSEMTTSLRGAFSSSEDESDSDSQQSTQPAVLLSEMDIELNKLEELRSTRGKAYAKSEHAFNICTFFDTDYRKEFPMLRKLTERGESVVLDESQCERDFSLSGRVFTALRERLGTEKGERLVRIPLRDATFPATVTEVKAKYFALKKKRQEARKDASTTQLQEEESRSSNNGSSSSSDSNSSESDDDSSESDDDSSGHEGMDPISGLSD
jgi:hypothetical protein